MTSQAAGTSSTWTISRHDRTSKLSTRHRLIQVRLAGACLARGRRLELDYQFGGHPATVLYRDALCPGPLADLGRVQPVRRCLAPAAGRAPDGSAGPTGSTDVVRQRVPQRLGVFGGEGDRVTALVVPLAPSCDLHGGCVWRPHGGSLIVLDEPLSR